LLELLQSKITIYKGKKKINWLPIKISWQHVEKYTVTCEACVAISSFYEKYLYVLFNKTYKIMKTNVLYLPTSKMVEIV